MTDDHDDEPVPHIAFPIPPELLRQHQEEHERAHRRVEALRMDAFALIEELRSEQLTTLVYILHLNKNNRHMVEGTIVWELRKRGLELDGSPLPMKDIDPSQFTEKSED